MTDQFYLGSKIPEVFRIADEQVNAENPKKEYVREPYEVPMPSIQSNPNVEGPIHMTKEEYERKKIKQQRKYEKKTREAEVEIIQYLAREEMIKSKLAKLDPCKKKDSKKIAAYNIELKNLRANIEMLQEQYGIKIDSLDRGSKVSRFFARLKKKATRIVRKIKKWYERNDDLVIGVLGIALPVLISSLIAKIIA